MLKSRAVLYVAVILTGLVSQTALADLSFRTLLGPGWVELPNRQKSQLSMAGDSKDLRVVAIDLGMEFGIPAVPFSLGPSLNIGIPFSKSNESFGEWAVLATGYWTFLSLAAAELRIRLDAGPSLIQITNGTKSDNLTGGAFGAGLESRIALGTRIKLIAGFQVLSRNAENPDDSRVNTLAALAGLSF